jgi:hypothetical protein
VRNDANTDAQQAASTTAGDHRRKKVKVYCINQIGISENHNLDTSSKQTSARCARLPFSSRRVRL